MTFSSAPLLSPLRTKGGTFYTFSSAVRDMSTVFATDSVKMSFSRFACLNVPRWENSGNQSIFFDGSNLTPQSTDPNLVFPKAVIQNYIENMIQYSEGERNDMNPLSNFAESAFFKALLTANFGSPMELQSAGTVYSPEIDATVPFYEEIDASGVYEPLIKYVGALNTINQVTTTENEYTSFQVTVPNNSGLMSKVKLRQNFNVTHSTVSIPNAGGEPDFVVGLGDFENTDQVDPIFDTVDFKYSVGGNTDRLGLYWDDIESDSPTHTDDDGDYDFNCVLIYYDILDEADESTLSRNLYGFLLLDKFTVDGGGYISEPVTKFQPDADSSGNSYGFKFNLRFSNSTSQVSSFVTSDGTGLEMEMYKNVLDELRKSISIQSGLESTVLSLEERLTSIEATLLSNFTTVQNAATIIETVESRLLSLENNSSGDGDVRISNEDLFVLFSRAISSNGGSVTVNLTRKALLPTIVTTEPLLFKDDDDVYYTIQDGEFVITTLP